MIAPHSPAADREAERRGVLAVVQVRGPAALAEARPLQPAAAIPAIVARRQRYQCGKIQLPTAATVGPIGATPIRAPGGAGGDAGRSQT